MKQKTLCEDAHCGVQCKCRKRPPQARECAKAHSFMMEIPKNFRIIQGILFSVNWGHHFSQHKKAPEHTDLVVYPGGIWKYMETSADIRGRFFSFTGRTFL